MTSWAEQMRQKKLDSKITSSPVSPTNSISSISFQEYYDQFDNIPRKKNDKRDRDDIFGRIKQQTPIIKQNTPIIKQNTPIIKQQTPIKQNIPIKQPVSNAWASGNNHPWTTQPIKQQTPIKQNTPQIKQQTPQIKQQTPQIKQPVSNAWASGNHPWTTPTPPPIKRNDNDDNDSVNSSKKSVTFNRLDQVKTFNKDLKILDKRLSTNTIHNETKQPPQPNRPPKQINEKKRKPTKSEFKAECRSKKYDKKDEIQRASSFPQIRLTDSYKKEKFIVPTGSGTTTQQYSLREMIDKFKKSFVPEYDDDGKLKNIGSKLYVNQHGACIAFIYLQDYKPRSFIDFQNQRAIITNKFSGEFATVVNVDKKDRTLLRRFLKKYDEMISEKKKKSFEMILERKVYLEKKKTKKTTEGMIEDNIGKMASHNPA